MRFVGIDPASKTGFVALGPDGMPLKSKEITGSAKVDPERMATLIDNIIYQVEKDDIICIEGFPFSTQKAMFAGGLHHGIRNELWKKGIRYYEVAPNAVKKFVAVTGWEGEVGNKRRLQGKEKKRAVMDAVKEHYGFVHSSDNVVDAYILAQIARSKHTKKVAYEHQLSVVENLKLA
jgi:crossover junction endodeoxyribonuclease RuvC